MLTVTYISFILLIVFNNKVNLVIFRWINCFLLSLAEFYIKTINFFNRNIRVTNYNIFINFDKKENNYE